MPRGSHLAETWALVLLLCLACHPASARRARRAKPAPAARPGARPVLDIYVRTWKQDTPFLAYMLRSVEEHVPRDLYRHLIVAYHEEEHAFFQNFLGAYRGLPIRLLPEQDTFIRTPSTAPGDLYNTQGYMMQMLSKYMPWKHSDADYFMHLDSDVVVRRPINRTDIMDDRGRVYYSFVEFASLTPAQGMWRQPSEALLKEPVPRETMTGFPFVYPRELYTTTMQRVEAAHGKPFLDVLRAVDRFNEFTPMGHVLMTHMPARCVEKPNRLDAFEQVHSYDGLTPDIVARFEGYLRKGRGAGSARA